MMRTVKRQRGQGLIEYALLILLLIGFLGGGVIVAKDPILSLFSSINGPVSGATPTPGPGNPTPPPDGSTPTGHATDLGTLGGYTYISGTHWSPNATVTVTWSNGPWIGTELGTFTVGANGSNDNYASMYVWGMDVGSYSLLFTSGAQTATTTLNVLDSAYAPWGSATDTRVGGQTNVSGAYWLPNATVTVTYASGPDNGQPLGTFVVGSDGSSSGTPMAVDPALGVGLYSLSFVSGTLNTVATFNINDPQGSATDTGLGGITYVSGLYWLPDSNITVTYADGLHSGQVLGTFVVGHDGNSTDGTPMTVAADLPAGSYDLSFTSDTQNATATFSIWNPEGDASSTGPGGLTDVAGFYWSPNAIVTVTYPSGTDNGAVLGHFTVNADGNSDDYVSMPVAADLTPGDYSLSFTSNAQPPQNATATLTILSPEGFAWETVAGEATTLGGSYWPTNSTVTVTYTATSQVLGSFTVDAYGSSNGELATVDANLAPATYDLSFDAGLSHATNTLIVDARPAPVGYAGPDARMGSTVNVGGHYWPANAVVTVAYSEGDLMGDILGTFTVDAAGDSSSNDYLPVDPSLSLGEHGLSFASGGQTAAATFNIEDPTGQASDAHVGGNTNVGGLNWANNDVVTVTYANGADQGRTLGTFTVNYWGQLFTPVPLAVDPGLDPGSYDLRFTSSGGQSITVPLNILSSPLAITIGTDPQGPLCQGDTFPVNTEGTIYIAGTQIGTWTADAWGHLTCVIMLSAPTTPQAFAALPGASTCDFKTTVGGHTYTLASPSCNPQSWVRQDILQSQTIYVHPDYVNCGVQGPWNDVAAGCVTGYLYRDPFTGEILWEYNSSVYFANGSFIFRDGSTPTTNRGPATIIQTDHYWTYADTTGWLPWGLPVHPGSVDQLGWMAAGYGNVVWPYHLGDLDGYTFTAVVYAWNWEAFGSWWVHT